MNIASLVASALAATRSPAKTSPSGTGKPKSRWLWHTVAWPLAFTWGFLLFVIGSSIYLLVAAQFTAEVTKRTLGIENELIGLLTTVEEAESGQRGYLLTSDPAYLDVYRAAENAFAPKIAELKADIVDAAQQAGLAGMEPLIARKFAEMAETIRLHDSGDREGALALVRTGAGRDLMTELRARTAKLWSGEARVLARASPSTSGNRWLVAVNLAGLALIVVLAAIFFLIIRRLMDEEFARVLELERSNQELDDFAYIASHDLKEPLRGLFNHATFLREDYSDKIDEDGVRRLARLGQLCQRMERLIDDLMYFSRLGRSELALRDTDPNAIIVEIRLMMETTLAERHARIVVPEVMPRIVCDKTALTEVFRNLITNAVRYNDKAEPRVEIGFLKTLDAKHRREKDVYYVKDNGIGIDPEFHEQIFRIFKRLQRVPDGAGSGVGLTFVKKIVERHGGSIWLESEPGAGTVFYFSLNRGRKIPARNARERAFEPNPVHSAG